MNAIKHGCRAKLPIIPGEDHASIRTGSTPGSKFDPRDPVELYLVEARRPRSWQLDRADRAEIASLADEAASDAEDAVAKADEIAPLLRRPGDPSAPPPIGTAASRSTCSSPGPSIPTIPTIPPGWSRRLEATAAGCSWLLNMAELDRLLETGQGWQPLERLRAIRLLGKQPLEVIADEQVLSIYLASRAMDPEGPDVFAEPLSDLNRPDQGPRRQRRAETFAAARERQGPADAAAGRAVLRGLIATATARVSGLREAGEATEAAGLADIMARLSHRCKQTMDWLHDHQGSYPGPCTGRWTSCGSCKNFGDDAAGYPSPLGESSPPPSELDSVGQAVQPDTTALRQAGQPDLRTGPSETSAYPYGLLEWVESSDISPLEREPAQVGPAEVRDDRDTKDLEAGHNAPARRRVSGRQCQRRRDERSQRPDRDPGATPPAVAADVTNEANLAADPPAIAPHDDSSTTGPTNEANARKRSPARPMPAVAAPVVALLALLIWEGPATALGSRQPAAEPPVADRTSNGAQLARIPRRRGTETAEKCHKFHWQSDLCHKASPRLARELSFNPALRRTFRAIHDCDSSQC